MKSMTSRARSLCLLMAPGLFVIAFPSLSCAENIADLLSAQGRVTKKEAGSEKWSDVQVGAELQAGSEIQTAELSRAGVAFKNGVLVRLKELSSLKLHRGVATETVRIERGSAYFFSRTSREFPAIETPLVTAGIRGTEFVVDVEKDKVTISVLRGAVEAKNQFGTVVLTDHEQAITKRGEAPTKQILAHPLDAVQWALYFPAVLSVSDFAQLLQNLSLSQRDGFGLLAEGKAQSAENKFRGAAWQDFLGRALSYYIQGDLSKAEIEIEKGERVGGLVAAYALARSSIMLAGGRVDGVLATLDSAEKNARSILELALKNKALSLAYSQRAILEIVQNRPDLAISSAAKAISMDPTSATAAYAMSYVEQSRFNLNDALLWAVKAMEWCPGNPALIARVAELNLSLGDVDAAQNQLDSSSLESSGTTDARLLTTKGFVALTRSDIDIALDAFRSAINRDSTVGLPRVGLGLALIRSGKLVAGREAIETAVALEPNVSLFRSYLGKAYFEEENNSLAAAELATAIELDPLDPTPYLYRSYNKLSQHNPVEALADVEESITRNNNRAVYRSRLLLDQDLAVRGLGLSQTYTQLGFDAAAREEAIKSIQRDYRNYSAHLLLASSYADSGDQVALAALSEFFLSQLLAPRDFNFFRDATGGQASFNEYASLFDRNRFRTSIVGSTESGTDSVSGEVDHTGSFDHLSYLLSYSNEYDRGYRTNDFNHVNTSLIRIQGDPTFKTTLSSSTLYVGFHNGDDAISFDPQGTDPDVEQKQYFFVQQFGVRRVIDPTLLFIGQGLLSRSKIETTDLNVNKDFLFSITQQGKPIFVSPFSVLTDRVDTKKFKTAELDGQFIKDADIGSFVFGAGETLSYPERSDIGTISPQETILTDSRYTLDSSLDQNEQFGRVYSYSTWHVRDSIDINLGGSFAHLRFNDRFASPYDNDLRDVDRFNVKTGFSAYLTPSTTLRGAYFENVGTVNFAETGTIEPTLVAGFNQNLNDTPGVVSKNLGIGISHKLASSTYVGTEFTLRDLSRDIVIGLDGVNAELSTEEVTHRIASDRFEFNGKEKRIRTYINQVLTKRDTAVLEHRWSGLDDDQLTIDGQVPGRKDTNEFGLGLNHFTKSGIIARTAAEWRLQSLDNFGQQLPSESDGTRDFWLWNGSLSYELPNRYGTITLAVKNILDTSFRYAPTGLGEEIIPERSLDLGFSITF